MGPAKVPLVKWKTFTTRLPTEREVGAWWDAHPHANIAIVTGHVSGLVVADVDPDRGGDVTAWEIAHPTARSADTPRGGRHFFYAYSGPTRNSVGKVASGVDIRGDGGYVVAPPSTRRDGRAYVWRTQGAMAPLLIQSPERSPISSEHWLDGLLRGVSSGERNDACARLAGYFLGRHVPSDVVEGQLLAWNRLNSPPLPEEEIRRTVQSVAQASRSTGVGEEHGPYDLIALPEYLSKYGATPLSWLVKDWLPEQTVGMVVAPPGSYKTWLLQDLAVSIASGLPFLGQFPVERAGPVLFMQQEDWHGQTAHRFSLIVARRADLSLPTMSETGVIEVDCPPALPIYLHEHRGFRFDDKDVVRAWIAAIRRLRPLLVVLDPLYSAGSVEDFMAGTARDMFLFKSIRDTYGTAFLIAHHTRKSSKEKFPVRGDQAPEREDVWGSQFLNAWMETGWQIRRREEIGTASIARHFKVQSDAMRAILGFHIDTTVRPGKYEVSVQEIKPGEREAGADLVALLERYGPLSVAQLVEKAGLHRTTVHRRLDNLMKASVIRRDGIRYTVNQNLEAGS